MEAVTFPRKEPDMLLRAIQAGTLVTAILAAAPARALPDLTGSWTGTLVCDAIAQIGGATHSKAPVTLVVDDTQTGLAYARLAVLQFHVTVLADPDAPAKGRIGGPECNNSFAETTSVLQLSVKAKDGSAKGTLAGELVTTSIGTQRGVQVCRLKLKRATTTIETPIEPCVP
jgi:hypothetical protein